MKAFISYLRDTVLGKINRDYQSVAQQINYLQYLPKSRSFEVTKKDMNMSNRAVIRREIMTRLIEYYPPHKIRLSHLKLEYYDKCLHRYLEEMLKRSFASEETCWNRLAQRYKCRYKLDGSEKLDTEEEKSAFLSKFKFGELYKKEKGGFKSLIFDKNGFVFFPDNNGNLGKEIDKALPLCLSIEKNGWSNYTSNTTPIVVGYSNKSKTHNIILGRHRVAALMYLYNTGKIKDIAIDCHYVEYPFDSLILTRPFKEPCLACRWNEAYQTPQGTHQDYKIQAGVVTVLGKKAQAKWKLVEKCFDQLVRGKSVVDIGAHRGMYCFKALEHGAQRATAVDITNGLLKYADEAKKHCGQEKLNIEIRDFYKDDDYKYFISEKYDTGIFLGVIHHLLRLGIQQKILYNFDELIARIAKMVNYGVIIEFAMPKEYSLELPEIKPYQSEFSQAKFEQALGKYFSQFKNLGKCNYVSGNKYGRFMYYATK